ncbi:hypothetical protein PRIPAC_90793 [Pristionchus pacificus]|uniref:Uncharacterized protein n=1 Tax=Pristionchus pacificus TaxID=54126 RepID=A0A2A6CYV8_PRIPA|nr:hypothetical protein PRIPAC_90793 [Pristionchus pacificus]|eukprot:PDM83211.1 hypothetical protein PRIPAC_34843 [Pristionchus pacificus]
MDRSAIALLLFFTNAILIESVDLVSLACFRDPRLPFCGEDLLQSTPRDDVGPPLRRAPPPVRRREREDEEERGGDIDDDLMDSLSPMADRERKAIDVSARRLSHVLRETQRKQREEKEDREMAAAGPAMSPIMLALFPALQKDKNPKRYCKRNEYTFQVTCTPGKKLRYDLQVFCQEFSDTCGIPNLNLVQSRAAIAEEGRPHGYGQKQKNGNFGMGNSFAMGFGVVPGLELTGSRGADIGDEKLPYFNQIGGMMVNNGMDVGAMGRRRGKGAARMMNSLTHGFPSLGLAGVKNVNDGDRKGVQETFRSLGIPTSLASLGKLLGGSQPNKRNREFYEPGYGALDKKTFAFGQVDHDEFNVPAGLGDVEINRGSGIGFG